MYSVIFGLQSWAFVWLVSVAIILRRCVEHCAQVNTLIRVGSVYGISQSPVKSREQKHERNLFFSNVWEEVMEKNNPCYCFLAVSGGFFLLAPRVFSERSLEHFHIAKKRRSQEQKERERHTSSPEFSPMDFVHMELLTLNSHCPKQPHYILLPIPPALLITCWCQTANEGISGSPHFFLLNCQRQPDGLLTTSSTTTRFLEQAAEGSLPNSVS